MTCSQLSHIFRHSSFNAERPNHQDQIFKEARRKHFISPTINFVLLSESVDHRSPKKSGSRVIMPSFFCLILFC